MYNLQRGLQIPTIIWHRQLADWIGWGDENFVSVRLIYFALYTPPHVFLVSFILEYASMLLTQRPEPVITSDNM